MTMAQPSENIGMPRVISTGVDTLTFTAPLMPDGKLRKWLDQKQQKARESDEPLIVELCGLPFTVSKGGAQGGFYHYGLLSPDVGNIWVSVERDRGVKCELGSFPLWCTIGRGDTVAAVEAYRQLRRCLCDLFKCADGFAARPTRVDFCIDFQGWRPPREDELAAVSRSTLLAGDKEGTRRCEACGTKHRVSASFCSACGHRLGAKPAEGAGYVVPFELDEPRTFRKRRKLTGLTWGTGKALMLRIYDKTVEIRDNSPDKVWFPEVWKVAGAERYVDGEPVMRLEVECKRPFLKSLRIDGRKLETVEDVIDNAATIVRYLIGYDRRTCQACGDEPEKQFHRFCRKCGGTLRRPKGWLELRERIGERPDRWPLLPQWQALQRAPFAFSQPPAIQARRVREGASREIVRAMTMGTASTWAALAGVRGQLRHRLGRRPTDQELWQRTCELMGKEADPGSFCAAIERKELTRRINPDEPARTERDPEDRDARTFRRTFDKAAGIFHVEPLPEAAAPPSPTAFRRAWRTAVKPGHREQLTERRYMERLEEVAARRAADEEQRARQGTIFTDQWGRRWRNGKELSPDV